MAVTLVSFVGSAVSRAETIEPTYTTYAACGRTETSPPSHECKVGDELGAFFRSNLADVEYEICTSFPARPDICVADQQATMETLYVNSITSSIPGLHTVTWRVNGAEVGSWTFRLVAQKVKAPHQSPPRQPIQLDPASIYIAGVKPEMTRHRVRSILGGPSSVRTWRSGRRVVEREWHYRDRLSVAFEVENGRTRRVDRVRTYSPRDRLANGLRVGVREGAIHRKLPNAVCARYGAGGPSAPFPSGYVCNWFPRQNSDPCGPNLIFYMRHKGLRIRYIELEQNAGEGCG